MYSINEINKKQRFLSKFNSIFKNLQGFIDILEEKKKHIF